MEPDQVGFHVVIPEIARSPHVEAGAGIYLHDGRTHLVGHRSNAEIALQAAGALLVATVRFDRFAADVGRRCGPFSRITPASVLRHQLRPSTN